MRRIDAWHREENGATTVQVVALVSVVAVLLLSILMVFRTGGSDQIAADTDKGLVNQTELFDGRGHLPPGVNGNAQIGLGDGNAGDSGSNGDSSGGESDSSKSPGGFSEWLRNWKTISDDGGSGNPLAAIGNFVVDAGNRIVDGFTSLTDSLGSAWDGLPNPVKGILVGIGVGLVVAAATVAVVATAPVWLLAGIVGAAIVAGGVYGWSVRDQEFSILSAASWTFMASGTVATLGITQLGLSATFTWAAIRNSVIAGNLVQLVIDSATWALTGHAPYTNIEDAMSHYFVATLASLSIGGVFSGLASKFGFLNKMIQGNMRGYGRHPFYKNVVKPLHNVVIQIPGQKGVTAGTVAKWLSVAFTALKGPAEGVNKSAALNEEYGMDDALSDYVGEGVGDLVGDSISKESGSALFGELVGEGISEGNSRIRELTL